MGAIANDLLLLIGLFLLLVFLLRGLLSFLLIGFILFMFIACSTFLRMHSDAFRVERSSSLPSHTL